MRRNVNLFTSADCTNENVWDIELEGKIVILDMKFFKEEYREAKYQLVRCTGGFGCSPHKSGNAIFIAELHPDNPEHYRIERCDRDILGVASEKAIEEFKEVYGWNGTV